MLRNKATKALLLLLATAMSLSPAQAGVMLQGFYWETGTPAEGSWWRHLAHHGPEMRNAGVTAIWIPGPQKGSSGGYSMGYDPYDWYDLGSKDQMGSISTRFGNKEELLAMIAILHRQGIDTYADCVVNHRGGGSNHGYDYSSLRGSEALGRFPMSRRDFNDPYAQGEWDREVGGGRDINHHEPYVRDGLHKWIRWFDNQTGVDGYRLDAAKHMDPWFTEGLLYQVQEGNYKSRKDRYVVSEYYDGNPNTLGWYVGQTKRRTAVFDFGLRYNIKDVVHGNGYTDIRKVLHHLTDYEMSSPFINNHDTFQRGNGSDIYWRGNMAHCFILTMPGYPCLYYLDLYDSRQWIRPFLRTLMWVHTFQAHGDFITRYADGDLLVNERSGNLITGINDNGNDWRTTWVPTNFGPNAWLHDFSGIGPDKWTNAQGWVEISVPPNGYVNYGRAFSGSVPNPGARRTIQEYEAAPDMDLPRAGEFWGPPIRFASNKGEPIYVDLYLGDKSVEGNVAIFDQNGRLLTHAKGRNGHVYTSFYNPPQDGWYQVRVALTQTGQNKRSNYFLKTSYMGPWQFPATTPPINNSDPNLPSLR